MSNPPEDAQQRPPEAPQRHTAAHTEKRFYITAAATLCIPEADIPARLPALRAGLPPRAARRMSHLGLMLSHLIGQTGIDEETVVLYASQFGEGRTLENYLESFPQASPLGFQSSIHPGGVEQALILRQQPVREFFPITASESLPLALLRTLEQCHGAQRILLLGGEESATWLSNSRLAADTNFAFALRIEPQPDTTAGDSPAGDTVMAPHSVTATNAAIPTDTKITGNTTITSDTVIGEICAIGTLPEHPARHTAQAASTGSHASVTEPTLHDLCAAITTRTTLQIGHPEEGCWQISWRT